MRNIQKFENFSDNYQKDNVCLDSNGAILKVGDIVRTIPNQDAFDMESIDIEEYNEEIFTIGKIEKHEIPERSRFNYLKGIYKIFVDNSGSWFYNIECEKI